MLFHSLQKKKYHGKLLDTPRNSDDRCEQCGGICCTSFTAIDISWDEYIRLEKLGAKRLQQYNPGKSDCK